MTQVIASALLANGLRTEFADTYQAIRNRQADSRLATVMDLSINATNRQHEFGYFEAAPHMEYWAMGDPVPADAMQSVQFKAYVHNWARRVGWSKFDRSDEQTQTLMDMARMAGASAALLPERMFFDLINGTTTTLPTTVLAPDGAAFFATTAGGAARFGATNGNLLTGSGVSTVSQVLADYYAAIEQFLLFQDGKGQPLLSPETVASGVTILHAVADTQLFETAFMQQRQGVLGPDNTTDAVTSVSVSNIVQDASRNVSLWGSPRLATGDWYVFLKNAPKKATFHLQREGLKEYTALDGDNNSDYVRDTGREYVQWECREGAGIALPFSAIKVNN